MAVEDRVGPEETQLDLDQSLGCCQGDHEQTVDDPDEDDGPHDVARCAEPSGLHRVSDGDVSVETKEHDCQDAGSHRDTWKRRSFYGGWVDVREGELRLCFCVFEGEVRVGGWRKGKESFAKVVVII